MMAGVRYYETSGQIVFVRFLEELKTPKRHFEIALFPSNNTRISNDCYVEEIL